MSIVTDQHSLKQHLTETFPNLDDLLILCYDLAPSDYKRLNQKPSKQGLILQMVAAVERDPGHTLKLNQARPGQPAATPPSPGESHHMKKSHRYAVIGVGVAIIVNILINLLSTGLQQQFFANPLSAQTLWLLGGLVLLFGVIGYWLGLKAQSATSPAQPDTTPTVSANRLKAKHSEIDIAGQKRVLMDDATLKRSKIKINTKD